MTGGVSLFSSCVLAMGIAAGAGCAQGGSRGSGGQGARGGTGTGGAPSCRSQGQSCSDSSQCCAGLTCISTCVPNVSDKEMKRDFAPVDRDEVLEALAELPISSWSYKTEASRARHIGPMAQDFMSTFRVGSSDKTILQVDADGVTLAAIQALNEKVRQLSRESSDLRRELRALRSSLPTEARPSR